MKKLLWRIALFASGRLKTFPEWQVLYVEAQAKGVAEYKARAMAILQDPRADGAAEQLAQHLCLKTDMSAEACLLILDRAAVHGACWIGGSEVSALNTTLH